MLDGQYRRPWGEECTQSGAAGCEKSFVKCLLKAPLACLGSMAVAVQPNCLSNSKITFYKTFFTTSCPRLYTVG